MATAKTTVATDMLGAYVRVVMGLEPSVLGDTAWMAHRGRDAASPYAGWRHLGDYGFVRAVYMSEDTLMVGVELGVDRNIVEVQAKHVAVCVLPDPGQEFNVSSFPIVRLSGHRAAVNMGTIWLSVVAVRGIGSRQMFTTGAPLCPSEVEEAVAAVAVDLYA